MLLWSRELSTGGLATVPKENPSIFKIVNRSALQGDEMGDQGGRYSGQKLAVSTSSEGPRRALTRGW